MNQKSTLKHRWLGTKIASVVTLLFSLFALQSIGQQVQEFDYTGTLQTVTLTPGPYQFEAWGAQGGDSFNNGAAVFTGGKGGYSSGKMVITENTTLYIYVGGQGVQTDAGFNTTNGSTPNPGGFNGGGIGHAGGGGGGGATHIATASGLLNTLEGSQNNILLVAGAGGGATISGCGTTDGSNGGAGGGINAPANPSNTCGGQPGTPGSSTAGGNQNGAFGLGGSEGDFNDSGAGGAGYYGGGAGGSNSQGGGGSSFSNPAMTDVQHINGLNEMPTPEEVVVATGREGNGYVKITLMYGLELTDLTDATCPDSENGSIGVEVSGGVAPYTFQWSNGEAYTTGEPIDGYSLLGHFGQNSYYRSNNQIATAEAAQIEAEEFYGNLISINSAEENAWILANGIQPGDNLGASDAAQEGTWAWASGESFEYTNWSPGEPNNGGGNGQDYIQIYANGTWDDVGWAHFPDTRHVIETSPISKISNLAPGEYTVTVTDANGLETSGTYTVGPDPIEVSFDMTQTITCEEIGNGALTANVTGGTAPYTYEWSSGETSAAISDKSFGEYTVTVTDANNCDAVVASESITTNDLTPPVASVLDIDVYLDNTGAASIVAPDVDGGSTDDCFISNYSIDVSEFSCADVGGNPSFDGNTVIAFDGEDDYLEFDQVIPYSANHTFAFWIKTEPGSGGTAFTWGSPTVNNSTGLRIWSNRIRYSSVDGPGQTQTVNTSPFLGDNEWHHVVAVRNGNDVQIFVDGQLDVSGQITNQISNPTSTSLGGGLINGIYQSFMNGQLDEFAYWPQALSQQEAEGLMCAGIQGAEVFLDFESGSGTTAVADVSGNGNSATLTNMDGATDWVAFGDALPLTSCPAGVKVRLSVTDAGGNQAHADAYVTVRDTVSPIASARSHSLELNLNGEVTATAQDFDDGSTDNCEIESFSLNKSAFTCEDLGSNDIVLTVTDIHGNTKSEVTQVEIVDEIEPEFSLEDTEVSLGENGEVTILPSDLGSASDNCAVASVSINIDTFTCEDLGESIEVVYTAMDQSGNESQESVMVTVVDNQAPTVDEAQEMTLYLDENGQGLFDSSTFIENAADNCSVERIVGFEEGSFFDIDGTPYDCSVLGENPGYILYAEDGSGNRTEFTVDFTVLDTVKPIIPADQSISITLDANGQATVDADMLEVIATDNCGIASRSLNQTEFSCEDVGISFMTFSVTDASGNSREQSVEVEVIDNISPVMAESLDMDIYLDENGLANFDSDPLLAQATDNCGLDMIAFQIETTYIDAGEFLSFDCASVGSMSETVYATDISGNGTPFTVNMTIMDTIKPSFDLNAIELQVDAEGMATLSEEMLSQYAADNCGVAEVAIQTEQFDCSQIGATQFTEIIVFDLHGNAKQQTLEVQLIDAIAPQVQVEDITIELGENGVADLSADLLEMMIIENCEPTDFLLSQSEFTCADLGSTAHSITVSDASGNSGEADFTVTVVDNAAPEISGPQIIDVCQGVPVSYDQILATDNCSAELNVIDGPQAGDTPEAGEFMVEFEAVDPSGNTTSAVIMLAVYPTAEVDLGEDMEVDEGAQITLIAGESNNNTYLWSDGSTGNMYQFVATEDVTVTVEVTTPEGCTVTDEINITIGSFLGVDEDENGNSVRFFPNPTSGNVSLELGLEKVVTNLQITIIDITGKAIDQQMIPAAQNGQVINFDLSQAAKGVYLVNVKADELNLTERIVKQ